MEFCLVDNSESADVEKPIEDISFDEIWITDSDKYPYTFLDGTSMATPAVAGEVAILAKNYPDDSASKRAARILAGTVPVDDFKDLCITGGKADVANALDENTYTPVINSIKAEKDGLHVKGFFFGSKDDTDVEISQGSSTWSVSGKTLEVLKVSRSGDGAGDILLKTPLGLKNEELKVTVTDRDKEKGRQSFERILSPEDPDEHLEKGRFYEKLPISETSFSYLKTITPKGGACALNGGLYFTGENVEKNIMDIISFKNGEWRKPEDLISTFSRIMAWNGMLVFFVNGRLFFHDGNRIVEKKEFIPEKTETEVTEDMKWVLTHPDENDVRFDFYYDGKDALLIRNREEKDEDGYVCDSTSAVYRLDPESGRGSYIGKLENYYKDNIVIAHEERPDSPNTIYFLGKGFDADGNQKDFIAEKATLDPFKTEAIDNIKPKDCRINEEGEYWTGCGVRNGIYLTGGRAVRENAGIDNITADNFFFDYSKPQDGFVPCEKRICDTAVSPVAAVAAYGKVYFLGCSKNGPVMCFTEADTLPHYGDSPEEPEKKVDYSDPASPLHLTDGSDVEKLGTDNAKYVFTLSSNTAVIGGTKSDISGFFEAAPGYDSSAKHRYVSSDKKIVKVNKKGILTTKKRGEIDITCEQKERGSSWQPLGEKMHLFVQVPEM